jgi:hypothetical protein
MMTQPMNSHNATHRQCRHPERGNESACTAVELAHTIQAALTCTTLPGTFIQTIETHTEVATLLSQDQFIDLVIPCRSNVLVCKIQQSTWIAVMGHTNRLCAIYLDETIDRERRCALWWTQRLVVALLSPSLISFISVFMLASKIIGPCQHYSVPPTLPPPSSTLQRCVAWVPSARSSCLHACFSSPAIVFLSRACSSN